MLVFSKKDFIAFLRKIRYANPEKSDDSGQFQDVSSKKVKKS